MSLPVVVDEWPGLVGQREPLHLSVFDGDDQLGGNALELARRIRRPLMPWQQDDVTWMLRTDPDTGMWTHPTQVIIDPRQNGKSEELLLVCLYGLFVRGENILYSTQQWKTARKLAIRFSQMVKSRADLRRRLARPPTLSQGQSLVTLTDGNELLFCTRSADTGQGLDKVDRVIYDEAYNLTEPEVTGPSLAQMAAPNPVTMYASRAVDVETDTNSHVLAGMRRAGLAHRPGVLLIEHAAPEPPAGTSDAQRKRLREDPEMHRIANPAYGVIQTDAKIEKAISEFCGTAAGRRQFEVHVLGWGRWPVDQENVPSEIPADRWRTMRNPAPELVGATCIAVFKTDVWAIVAAQRTRAGTVWIEVGWCDRAPADDVVRKVVDVVAAWCPAAVVVGGGDAAEIIPAVTSVGVVPVAPTRPQIAQDCAGFLSAATATPGTLAHSGQPGLATAVSVAVKHELGTGGFVWEESEGAAYAQLMAATLARGGLIRYSEPEKPASAPPLSAESVDNDALSDELDVLTVAF